MNDVAKAKAIRKAKWCLARMLCDNIYTEENKAEWIKDILIAMRDYLDDIISSIFI